MTPWKDCAQAATLQHKLLPTDGYQWQGMAAQHRQGPMHSCSLPLPGMSYLAETKRPAHTNTQRGKRERKNTPVIFPKKVTGKFQTCCTDLQQDALAFDKFTKNKDVRHRCTVSLHTCITSYLWSLVFCLFLSKREQQARAAAWSTGPVEAGSKRGDTDVFCRHLLNFYESPGRTLTNQSWLLAEERHHTHRK